MLRHVCKVFVILAVSLFAPLAAAQPFQVIPFSPGAGYVLPNGSFLSGDFRGIKRTDVMHVVANADYVNMWLSNRDGTFAVKPFRPWPGYALPNGILMIGDVAGNHRSSMVHAVANTDYANIWLSKGDGTFNVGAWQPWPGYEMSNGPMVMGDFAGDGRASVFHAVANTDYANIWLSKGDGTFNVKSFRPWVGYAMPNGQFIAAGVSGSGRNDIVHVVANTDYVNIWLSKGDGSFSVRSFRPWPGYDMNAGSWLTGDFNGDGKTDLVHVLNGYVNLWQSKGDGTFRVTSFTPWSGYALPNGVVMAADLNGDGKTDIFHAVANTDYANIWLSKGDGAFSVSSFSPWSGYAMPNGVWLAGDVSGNKKADIVHMVANTDYANIWLSGMPAPNEAAVEGIEVVQAIQDMAQDAALVVGKKTWVRVYLAVNSPVSRNGVSGVLQVRNASGVVVASVPSDNTITVPRIAGYDLHSVRDDLTRSLNFIIPTNATQAGVHSFQVIRLSPTLRCSNCATVWMKKATFQTVPPLRLRIVNLQYTILNPPAPPQVFAPTAADTGLLQSWLARAYPVANVSATTTTVAANAAWPFTCNQANAQLSTQRATEIGNGSVDARTHYIGLVSNGGGFMRGCSSGIPGAPDPTTVASLPTGPTAGGATPINVTGDTDASFGDWYGGHELAHTFGRSHPGFCNGNSSDDPGFPYPNGQISDNAGSYVGLDVGDAASAAPRLVLPGETRFDIMTYCNQPQWLSQYTYNAVLARLIAEDPSLTGPGVRPLATQLVRAAPVATGAPRAAMPQTLMRMPLPAPAIQLAAVEPVQGLQAAPETVTGASEPPAIMRSSPEANSRQPVEQRPFVSLAQTASISIVATLNLTRGSGHIESVRQVGQAMVETATPQSEASIRLLDRAGMVLHDRAERVRVDTDIPAGEDKKALISATLPTTANVATIELVLNGVVVDRLAVPATAPAAPAVHARHIDTGIVVQWTASHAGPRTHYDIEVSGDGRTWRKVAIGVGGDSATLTRAQLGGAPPNQVRIIAHDGGTTSAPGVALLANAPH